MARRNTRLSPPRSPAAFRSARLSSGLHERNRFWRLCSARSSPFSNTRRAAPHYPAFALCHNHYAPLPSIAALPVAIFTLTRNHTHLGSLYFVSRTAAPPFEVWQHFALLPVHAGMHLAPPLLCNYGGCKRGAQRQLATTTNILNRRNDAANGDKRLLPHCFI